MRTARDLSPSAPQRFEIEVAPMRRRHLRAVLGIESQVYPRPWTVGLYLSELRARDRVYLVARANGRVVGYGGLMLIAGEAHLTTLAVEPSWHRRQVGTRLMVGLTRAALAAECTAMTLEVRMTNSGAQELYRRFGFAPVGVRRNYYAEINEDALIMWAYDIDGAEFASRLETMADRVAHATIYREVPW